MITRGYGTAAECRKLVKLYAQAGQHAIMPLLCAGAAGKLQMAVLEPGDRATSQMLNVRGGSVIVLADYGLTGTGPTGWPQVRRLLRLSEATLIQCTKGFHSEYLWVAKKATGGMRTVIVETDLWHFPEWGSLLDEVRPPGALSNVSLPRDAGAARPGGWRWTKGRSGQ